MTPSSPAIVRVSYPSMSLLIFLLFVGVSTHDEWAYSALTLWPLSDLAGATFFGLAPKGFINHPGIAFLLMQLARAVLMFFYAWRCARYKKLLGKKQNLRSVHHAVPWLRMSMVMLFFVELGLGSLVVTRDVIGNWIVLDELLVMLPTLAGLFLAWTLYFPVDLKIRQSRLISEMDQNESPANLWSLGQYLKLNSRMELATMGLPLIAIMCWRECFAIFFPDMWPLMTGYLNVPESARSWLEEICLLVGTLVIFLLAPLLVLKVWRTQSLPVGEIRTAMTQMLQRYSIKVRDLLLWHTYGGVTNAAVIGTIPQVRYILLTDQLLETMSLDWLKAIMAHEIAHIRFRHLYWYLVILIAITFLLSGVWIALGVLFVWLGEIEPAINELLYRFQTSGLPALLGPLFIILGWWLIFGWVSRKFERQADTFAVEHFFTLRREKSEAISTDSAGAVSEALVAIGKQRGQISQEDVAPMLQVMNTLQKRMAHQEQADKASGSDAIVDIRKWLRHFWQSVIISWRHGSMQSRRTYLQKLVGADPEALRIHQTVKYIKRASVCIIMLFTLYSIYEIFQQG